MPNYLVKKDMHKYAVQITVADTRDGACSSSTLKEASSWGKVDVSKEQMVFAEATSVLPLIASDAFHRKNWKKDKEEIFKNYFKSMKKTRLALIQMKMSSDKEKNIVNSISKICLAKKKGANLVCLPELFLTNYFCQVEKHSNFNLAESIPGPTADIFSPLAKELNLILLLSIFEKRTSGIYHNTSIIINENGKIIGKYRKMHIPDDPQYYEKFYFTPGDLGFKSFKNKKRKSRNTICWDQWFPEAARLTALKGAEIILPDCNRLASK